MLDFSVDIISLQTLLLQLLLVIELPCLLHKYSSAYILNLILLFVTKYTTKAFPSR